MAWEVFVKRVGGTGAAPPLLDARLRGQDGRGMRWVVGGCHGETRIAYADGYGEVGDVRGNGPPARGARFDKLTVSVVGGNEREV